MSSQNLLLLALCALWSTAASDLEVSLDLSPLPEYGSVLFSATDVDAPRSAFELESSGFYNCSAAPGSFCLSLAINKAAKVPCAIGYYCPGNQSAILCPAGSYCPTPLSIAKCPEGSFCQTGSYKPLACSRFSVCPEGSKRFFFLGGLILIILILPFILIVQKFVYERWYAKKQAEAKELRRAVTRRDAPRRKSGAELSLSTASTLDPAPVTMDLSFENLEAKLTTKDKKTVTLLNRVSGEFKAGQVSCIMGPSGSGKTSLMNVLTKKVPYQSGTIRVNGTADRIEHYQAIVGFVPQDDIMIRTLTVKETLEHSALSRLPSAWPRAKKDAQVRQVLRNLGMVGVQHSIIGDEVKRGVSGGERKRASVGIELVAAPCALFLDEPITGLDSTTALDVMHQLQEVARVSNVNVVAVLHQPRYEIFSLIDRILLLAPGGRTVYFGPAADTLAYFESIGYPCPKNVNPTDWFLDVLSGSFAPISDSNPSVLSGQYELRVDRSVVVPHAEKQQRIGRIVGLWEERMRLRSPAAVIEPALEKAPEPSIVSRASFASRLSIGSQCAACAAAGPGLSKDAKCVACQHMAAQNNRNLRALSKSAGAGFFVQLLLSTLRAFRQYGRDLHGVMLDLAMHMAAGLVIGIAFVVNFDFLPPLPAYYAQYCPPPFQDSCRNKPLGQKVNLMSTYTVMAVGLTASVLANRTFGLELSNFFREARTGFSTLAYFLGKCFADIPFIALYSLFYCLAFYVMVSPMADFNQFYACLFLYELTMYSVGYISSVLLANPELARMLSGIAALLAGLAVDKRQASHNICWSSWFGEAMFITQSRYDAQDPAMQQFIVAYAKQAQGYEVTVLQRNLWVLFLYAVAFRGVTFALLMAKKRFHKL